jgi:hypothetical protein
VFIYYLLVFRQLWEKLEHHQIFMSIGMLENWPVGNKFDHMFIKNKNLNVVCRYLWNGGHCMPITCFSVNYICYCFISVVLFI